MTGISYDGPWRKGLALSSARGKVCIFEGWSDSEGGGGKKKSKGKKDESSRPCPTIPAVPGEELPAVSAWCFWREEEEIQKDGKNKKGKDGNAQEAKPPPTVKEIVKDAKPAELESGRKIELTIRRVDEAGKREEEELSSSSPSAAAVGCSSLDALPSWISDAREEFFVRLPTMKEKSSETARLSGSLARQMEEGLGEEMEVGGSSGVAIEEDTKVDLTDAFEKAEGVFGAAQGGISIDFYLQERGGGDNEKEGEEAEAEEDAGNDDFRKLFDCPFGKIGFVGPEWNLAFEGRDGREGEKVDLDVGCRVSRGSWHCLFMGRNDKGRLFIVLDGSVVGRGPEEHDAKNNQEPTEAKSLDLFCNFGGSGESESPKLYVKNVSAWGSSVSEGVAVDASSCYITLEAEERECREISEALVEGYKVKCDQLRKSAEEQGGKKEIDVVKEIGMEPEVMDRCRAVNVLTEDTVKGEATFSRIIMRGLMDAGAYAVVLEDVSGKSAGASGGGYTSPFESTLLSYCLLDC